MNKLRCRRNKSSRKCEKSIGIALNFLPRSRVLGPLRIARRSQWANRSLPDLMELMGKCSILGRLQMGETHNANQAPSSNRGDYSPFQVPTNSVQGFAPMPCVGFPNMVVDSRPAFALNTSQNWIRGIKLWIAGHPGASVAQLLAKLIPALPLSVKTEDPIYMERTERNSNGRPIAAIVDMMGARFGRTDSGRA